MAITQLRSKRKNTGGRYKRIYKKKLRELGNSPTLTTIGKKRVRKLRIRGGNRKTGLRSYDTANVYDPKTKKHYKVKIQEVVDNKANKNYIRRNIMTKGTIIKTEKGEAKILSRPGQEQTINAVLIK